jgi:hypothetical protein
MEYNTCHFHHHSYISGLNLYLRYIFHDKNDSGSEVLNTRKTNKQKYNDISDFPDIANIPLLYLVVNPTTIRP